MIVWRPLYTLIQIRGAAPTHLGALDEVGNLLVVPARAQDADAQGRPVEVVGERDLRFRRHLPGRRHRRCDGDDGGPMTMTTMQHGQRGQECRCRNRGRGQRGGRQEEEEGSSVALRRQQLDDGGSLTAAVTRRWWRLNGGGGLMAVLVLAATAVLVGGDDFMRSEDRGRRRRQPTVE
jgi:hypothetical protein